MSYIERLYEMSARKFRFDGKEISVDDTANWEIVVDFYEVFNEKERRILKTDDDEFYVFEYHEHEMYFGDTEIYTTWVKCQDFEDAYAMSKEYDVTRSPFFRMNSDYSILIVDKEGKRVEK